MIVSIIMKSRIIREALQALLLSELDDADILLSAGSGTIGSAPDIIIADHHSIYQKIDEQWPDAKILLINFGLDEEEVVNLLMSHKLSGVLSTEMEPSLIKRALMQVREGQIWLDNSNLKAILSKAGSITASGAIKPISIREQQILDYIAKGLRNKEIANHLYLSEQTVKAHLSNIFKKYNVSSRTQLMSLLSHSSH